MTQFNVHFPGNLFYYHFVINDAVPKSIPRKETIKIVCDNVVSIYIALHESYTNNKFIQDLCNYILVSFYFISHLTTQLFTFIHPFKTTFQDNIKDY